MDENPYRSPECCDQQEQSPLPSQPYYGIPDWAFTVMAIAAIIGTVVAMLSATVD